MQVLLWRIARDQAGATSIEYALIASFIAMALIAGAQAIGLDLIAIFNNVSAIL